MPEGIHIKIIDLEASSSSFPNFGTQKCSNNEDYAESNRGSIFTVQNITETPVSSAVQNISESVIEPIFNNWMPIIMETESRRRSASDLQRNNIVRIENAHSNTDDINQEDIALTLEEQRTKMREMVLLVQEVYKISYSIG